MLTVPSRSPPYDDSNNICRSAEMFQLFFPCFSFGIVAIGTGVIKFSSLAFGSDQLKQEVYQENERAMERYFSWYYAVYVDLKSCITRLPEEGYGVNINTWTSRLQYPPDRLQSIQADSFMSKERAFQGRAIQIISWLAKYKLNSLKKYKLVTPILHVMCTLLAESTDRNEDDDLAPDRAIAEVIDTMTLNLSKHVFPPVLDFASLSSQSPNGKFLEASVTALGVISESCLELRNMLRIVKSFHWCLFLQIWFLFLCRKSYYGLAAFCENMGEEIPPFLNPLMGKLISALQSSPRNLQETCMSAFGSVASAAEQAFLPYAERFLELMKVFMLLSNLQTILHEPVSQTFTFFHSIQLITYLDSAGKMHRVSKGDPKQVIQFDV